MEGYLRPGGIADIERVDDLKKYNRLTKKAAHGELLPEYNITPEELLVLNKESREQGNISSGTVAWVLRRLNEMQTGVINLSTVTDTPDDLRTILEQVSSTAPAVHKLNFLLSIVRKGDGSVAIHNSGRHWVFVSVEYKDDVPQVHYCDSLGWGHPDNLLQYLGMFTSVLRRAGVLNANIVQAHDAVKGQYIHVCGSLCSNYPLCSSNSLGGIISVFSAVVSTLDNDLFQGICLQRHKHFLQDPSRYETYLRRVMIHWFMSGNICMSLLKPGTENETSNEIHSHNQYKYITDINTRRTRSAPSRKKDSTTKTVKHNKDGKMSVRVIRNKIQLVPDSPNNNKVKTKEGKSPLRESKPKEKYKCNKSPSRESKVKKIIIYRKNLLDEPKLKKNIAESKSNKKYSCDLCSEKFSFKGSLTRHKKNLHHININRVPRSCSCLECPFIGTSTPQLITHYNEVHNKNMSMLKLSFKDEAEFYLWKSNIEKSSTSRYVQKRSKRKLATKLVIDYYCHRSGKQIVLSNKKRRVRDSFKMNNMCTAFMTMRKDLTDSSVTVDCCLDHIGHSCDMTTLFLSKEMRELVGKMLIDGFEIEKILEHVRSDVKTLGRDSLLSKRDIQNIRSSLIKSGQLKEDVVTQPKDKKKSSQREGQPSTYTETGDHQMNVVGAVNNSMHRPGGYSYVDGAVLNQHKDFNTESPHVTVNSVGNSGYCSYPNSSSTEKRLDTFSLINYYNLGMAPVVTNSFSNTGNFPNQAFLPAEKRLETVPSMSGINPGTSSSSVAANTLINPSYAHASGNIISNASHAHASGNIISSAPHAHASGNIISNASHAHASGNIISSAPHAHASSNIISSAPHASGNIISSAPHASGNIISSAPHAHASGNIISNAPQAHASGNILINASHAHASSNILSIASQSYASVNTLINASQALENGNILSNVSQSHTTGNIFNNASQAHAGGNISSNTSQSHTSGNILSNASYVAAGIDNNELSNTDFPTTTLISPEKTVSNISSVNKSLNQNNDQSNPNIAVQKELYRKSIEKINVRHQQAESSVKILKSIAEKEWSITSMETDIVNTVQKKLIGKCPCLNVCPSCRTCFHMYKCSCEDYETSGVGCEHIHAVHMSVTEISADAAAAVASAELEAQEKGKRKKKKKTYHHMKDVISWLRTKIKSNISNMVELVDKVDNLEALIAMADALQKANTKLSECLPQTQSNTSC